MGLAEVQDPVTFRTGVRDRLESQGEQVGLRGIVACVPVSHFPSPLSPDPHPNLRKFLTGEPTVASCACIREY